MRIVQSQHALAIIAPAPKNQAAEVRALRAAKLPSSLSTPQFVAIPPIAVNRISSTAISRAALPGDGNGLGEAPERCRKGDQRTSSA